MAQDLEAELLKLDLNLSELRDLEKQLTEAQQKELTEKLELSWVYHDNSLDGVVLTFQELVTALESRIISDVTMFPVCQEIRHFKQSIAFVRGLAESQDKINLELIKELDDQLTPMSIGTNPAENKGGQYRKEVPLHRTYFHEISPPDKISYQMRKLVEFIQTPKSQRPHPVIFASEIHFKLLNIFPFPKNSGKVARLLMNLVLMRENYPVVILHNTERQRYYESLRGSAEKLASLVTASMFDNADTQIRYINETFFGKHRRRHSA
jgi:Fic family protein